MIYEQFDKILLGDAYTSTNATQMAMRLYNQTSKATEGGISLLNGGSRLIRINSHTLAVGTEHPCRYVRVFSLVYAVDPADLWIFVTAKVCHMNEACPGCYPSELEALIDDCSSTAGPIEQTERR